MSSLFTLLHVLSLLSTILALGITVPPVKAGDNAKYLGINNLRNCISYPTVVDDMVLLTIHAGDPIPLQQLNLNIFDLDNNKIRFKRNIQHDIFIMFNNLHNDGSGKVNSEVALETRLNIYQRILDLAVKGGSFVGGSSGSDSKPKKTPTENHINSYDGKSLIYICFDNLYTDKLWLFRLLSKDIEVFTEIKSPNNIDKTNYGQYARFFNHKNKNKHDTNAKPDVNTGKDGVDGDSGFTEKDFDFEVAKLTHKLEDIRLSLVETEDILQALIENESRLRNINEAIFSGYTKMTIIVLVVVGVCGGVQILYHFWFLKRRKVI